jgi:CheY-like chemotaxis protein
LSLRLIGGSASVDIMISDIVMSGGINGLELAHRARALHPGLPILLVSGHPAAGLRKRAGIRSWANLVAATNWGAKSGQPAIGASAPAELASRG